MSLHTDPFVDRAMRANIGQGFHFFTNSNFHKSKSVAGVLSKDGRAVYVVERYRTARMGGVIVQTPHSRVIRVDLATGETDYLDAGGVYSDGRAPYRYVEAHRYKTNAQALKAARAFAAKEGA